MSTRFFFLAVWFKRCEINGTDIGSVVLNRLRPGGHIYERERTGCAVVWRMSEM
jgi:hypothetical protein